MKKAGCIRCRLSNNGVLYDRLLLPVFLEDRSHTERCNEKDDHSKEEHYPAFVMNTGIKADSDQAAIDSYQNDGCQDPQRPGYFFVR